MGFPHRAATALAKGIGSVEDEGLALPKADAVSTAETRPVEVEVPTEFQGPVSGSVSERILHVSGASSQSIRKCAASPLEYSIRIPSGRVVSVMFTFHRVASTTPEYMDIRT